MVSLKLKHKAYNKIHLEAAIRPEKEIKVEGLFSFNVDYNDDHTNCVATLKQELRSDPVDELTIAVECLGTFECSGIESDDDKKQAHVLAYHYLFPYVQSLISGLTVNAGLPPVLIEIADMKPENVVIKGKQTD